MQSSELRIWTLYDSRWGRFNNRVIAKWHHLLYSAKYPQHYLRILLRSTFDLAAFRLVDSCAALTNMEHTLTHTISKQYRNISPLYDGWQALHMHSRSSNNNVCNVPCYLNSSDNVTLILKSAKYGKRSTRPTVKMRKVTRNDHQCFEASPW